MITPQQAMLPGAAAKEVNNANDLLTNPVLAMPHVSTTGGCPNGRKIEGFLYRYHKGVEVKIVCVCHGYFLTPAEFTKHASGSDVAHPLKHIFVDLQNIKFIQISKGGHGQEPYGNVNGLEGSIYSGNPYFKNQSTQGIRKSTEKKSTFGVQSSLEQNEQNTFATRGTAIFTGAANQKEEATNLMVYKACVSTTGDGQNAKKTKGFLYTSHKGDEVKIVCACHGYSLTPAEFVEHSGSTDLLNPLRRIIVEPSSLL